MKQALTLFLLFSLSFLTLHAQTSVEGVVYDAETKETLPFATVIFQGTTEGTTTDMDGRYTVSNTNLEQTTISVSYLGYQTKTYDVVPGKTQTLDIYLPSNARKLKEIVVKGSKKYVKDTPAITLFRRVVKNKPNHRLDVLDAYSYEDYTKMEFDIYNIKESFTKFFLLRPFSFVFEYTDTTDQDIPYLPVLFKERISDVFYRKDPMKTKQVVKADHFSGFGEDDIEDTEMVDASFENIDIYQNVIVLAEKSFISPFAKGALASYRFFLTDSSVMDNKKAYKLEFTPRRKGDLCFTGHAWIDDESAAVKSLEIYLLDQANLNFINTFRVKQIFTHLNGVQWFKKLEQLEVSINLSKNKRKQSFRVVKTSSRDNININPEFEKDFFKGDATVIEENAYKMPEEYWLEARHNPLTKNESDVFTMVDRVQASKAYKHYVWWGHFFSSAFARVGPVELGRFYQFYTWNDLEGTRYRIGGRLNRKYFKRKLEIEGYVAYGSKDKLWKYHAGFKARLPRQNNKRHMIGGYYKYDWSNYDNKHPFLTHDHIIVSAMRTQPLDNLFLIREANGFYEKEWIRGFLNKFSLTHKTIYSWPGSYDFTLEDGTTTNEKINITELRVFTELGLGNKYFNRGFKRTAMNFSRPVLDLDYIYSPKGLLGSDYDYHKIEMGIKQDLSSYLGRTRYQFFAGKVFGRVPYPVLNIHRGNEGLVYNRFGYNSMQEFEYASDMWAGFWFRHKFDGLIFNAIPLVSKLKWRSIVYFKALAGDVSDANQIYLQGSSLTPIDNNYYAEFGIGLDNVFRVLRINFNWRLTQLDKPGIEKFSIKIYSGAGL